MRSLLLLFFAVALPGPVLAGESRWAAGLNYPGASLRYYPSTSYSLELRAQSEAGVTAAGLRCSRYLRAAGAALPFWGLEAALISFKGDASEGGGLALGALAGLEYFVTRSVSLQMDGGPYYISISDRRTGESSGGADFVFNLGLNFHFGKGGAR